MNNKIYCPQCGEDLLANSYQLASGGDNQYEFEDTKCIKCTAITRIWVNTGHYCLIDDNGNIC